MAKNALAVGLALGALAAACSHDTRADRTQGASPGEHSPADAQGRPMGIPDQHRMMQGMTDADLVPMLVAHHQRGIEMAKLEEANGASPEVKALATHLRQSREREIQELEAHGKAGGRDELLRSHGRPEMEPQGRDVMDRLRAVSGAALDQAFLQEMARQDQMAVRMVQMTTFQDGDLKRLADQMVSDGQQELEQITKLERARGAARMP